MIRLAVSGEEASDRDVATRLRAATIESCFDASRMTVPPAASDAVLFVKSCPLQAELIERCLSSGKHVLLAAESWLSSDLLERLSVAARQAGVQLAVVNPARFLPSRQLIRQQLDAGKLGEPGLVRVHRWEPATAANDRPSLGLPTPLMRDLELAVWLIGRPPNLVYAVEHVASDRDPATGRFVQVHLGFHGGGMALVDYADRLLPGDGYQSLSVIGSAGAAYADDHQNMQLVYRGGRPQAVRADERSQSLAALMQDFVDGLSDSRDFSVSVAVWRSVLTVADAVQGSLASRQAIVVEREGR